MEKPPSVGLHQQWSYAPPTGVSELPGGVVVGRDIWAGGGPSPGTFQAWKMAGMVSVLALLYFGMGSLVKIGLQTY